MRKIELHRHADPLNSGRGRRRTIRPSMKFLNNCDTEGIAQVAGPEGEKRRLHAEERTRATKGHQWYKGRIFANQAKLSGA